MRATATRAGKTVPVPDLGPILEPKRPTPSPGGEREVRIIGVPMDLGAGRRGVDMGPSAIRLAGVEGRLRSLGRSVVDTGDVPVPIPESRRPGPGPKYLREIVRACARLSVRVERILDTQGVPLVLGGDHSIAAGTMAGVVAHFRRRRRRVGLLYVDAHGDINTPETSTTGNVHGMPLAALLGMGPPELGGIGGPSPKVSPDQVVLLGIRNLDPLERENVRRSGVRTYTMRDIDERGMSAVVREALRVLARGTAGFHLSLDLDALDPTIAPGVGTPVRGGIGFREAHLLMEMAADSGRVVSVEVAELNPILDTRNATGELAVDLLLSALGKRIL